MLPQQTGLEHCRPGMRSLRPVCLCVTVASVAALQWSASCTDGYPSCAGISPQCCSSLSGQSVLRWTSTSGCCSQTRLARASMCHSCNFHRGLAWLLYAEHHLVQPFIDSPTMSPHNMAVSTPSHIRMHTLAVIHSLAHFRVGSRPLLARTTMRIGTPAKSKSLRMVFISCRRVRSDRATVRVNTANVGGRALTCIHRSGHEIAQTALTWNSGVPQ